MAKNILSGDATKGGMTYGGTHASGNDIPMTVIGGEKVKLEGGEGILSRATMQDQRTVNVDGKIVTPCEAASGFNKKNGGNSFDCSSELQRDVDSFDDGGKI